ncbi:MAG: hypothetical protein ACRYGP_17230 [Janthinobacterium lividum]
MRHHLLSAVLATICIGAASPVLADDADCGLLCRLSGYLSTDHMAAEPSDAGTAAPKGHRAHVAHKASAKAAPKVADKGKAPAVEAAKSASAKSASAKSASAKSASAKSASAKSASAKSASAKSASAKPVVAKATPVAAARATPLPAKAPEAEPHLAAVHPRSATRPAPRAEPRVVAEAAASPDAVTQPAHHRTASTRPPVQAAHAQTVSATIPGAAPAMPMGFQPFNVAFH